MDGLPLAEHVDEDFVSFFFDDVKPTPDEEDGVRSLLMNSPDEVSAMLLGREGLVANRYTLQKQKIAVRSDRGIDEVIKRLKEHLGIIDQK